MSDTNVPGKRLEAAATVHKHRQQSVKTLDHITLSTEKSFKDMQVHSIKTQPSTTLNSSLLSQL